jgi:hypothetical protein
MIPVDFKITHVCLDHVAHTQAPTPPKSLNKYCLSWGQVIPVGLNIPDSPSLAPKRESSNFGGLFFPEKMERVISRDWRVKC